eukprot:gene6456-8880_t
MRNRIRRLFEVDFLQNFEVDGTNDTDNSYKYHSSVLPYITRIDAIDELFFIYNPNAIEYYPLDEHFVTDGKKMHCFKFPSNCKIPPLTEMAVYTCPGKITNHAVLIEPHVLWTNHDGSLRRKEVLNNVYCKLMIYSPIGKCLSSCTVTKDINDGNPVIKRRDEEINFILQAIRFSNPIRYILYNIRLLTIILMGYFSLSSPIIYTACFWLGLFLDVIARGDAEADDPFQMTNVQLIGDRLTSIIVYSSVIIHYFSQKLIIFSSHNSRTITGINDLIMAIIHISKINPSEWHTFTVDHLSLVQFPIIMIIATALLEFVSYSLYSQMQLTSPRIIRKDLLSYFQDLFGQTPMYAPLIASITIGSQFYLIVLYHIYFYYSLWREKFALKPVGITPHPFLDIVMILFLLTIAYLCQLSFVIKQYHHWS